MMSKEPIALQLRFLQTMREISSEHNTTTFFPLPIDLLTALIKKTNRPSDSVCGSNQQTILAICCGRVLRHPTLDGERSAH